ncbi:oxygen-independent coproporphyrinogen III oxidase [Bacillus sp. ISL-40]|uniref:radical SAM family heme chaperone HemW n=1 Tax=unclassified Bacillus (in: firmicutes) TaxID=185979 RepID=UPI001BEBE4CD|nr:MULTISPECIES: radical SAM family heme chaperone HemW [unclassified Bacillus (in: firmicutes)]MBT2698001.1 oxygen-independent coproporphyrinogen III oxidase [Bacillus sp. ISL-40]MBT2721367.1 oxygen-independent coproporphyrinogen III oxidase [Bacillus sp. ISL-46]
MIKSAYLHIPFCEHICHYCDFNKVFLKGQPVDDYLNTLDQEMKMTVNHFPTGDLQTIFVGGGTPTSLNAQQLDRFCESINRNLPKSKQLEFTFEANPGDLTKEKLQILKDAGVNRLSLGVQTFNEELLKKIGRVHKAKDVYQTIDNAKSIGFENISIDLIFSLPSQTINDFKESLTEAYSLDISHYSAYSLIIEPKTVFYNLLKKGKLPTPGEDVEAAMYELLMEEMEKHGFNQYEISNFSKPGFESRHNLTYWNNESYYGFGAGAHSYLNGIRRSNTGPLKRYMDQINNGILPVIEEHQTTKVEQMEEEMFLGLRKTAGVSVRHFIEKFAVDPLQLFEKEIAELTAKQWLEVGKDHIFLTKKGRLLGNEVFQAFLR